MERNYKRDYEFQKKINLRQTEQIESLKLEVEKLKALCEEKDKTINSVDSLRIELTQCRDERKEKQKEYNELIEELKDMKTIMNQTVFKGRWRLIKFLMK